MYLSEFMTYIRRCKRIVLDDVVWSRQGDHITKQTSVGEEHFDLDSSKLTEEVRRINDRYLINHQVSDAYIESLFFSLYNAKHMSDYEYVISDRLSCAGVDYYNDLLEFSLKVDDTYIIMYYDWRSCIYFSLYSDDTIFHHKLAVLHMAFCKEDAKLAALFDALPAVSKFLFGVQVEDRKSVYDFYLNNIDTFTLFYNDVKDIKIGHTYRNAAKDYLSYCSRETRGHVCIVSVHNGYVFLCSGKSKDALCYGCEYSPQSNSFVPVPVAILPDCSVPRDNSVGPITTYMKNNHITDLDEELKRLFALSGNMTAMKDLLNVIRDIS